MVRIVVVNFQNNKTIYHPGEAVKGDVVITLEQDLEMKEILVEMTGEVVILKNRKNHSGPTTRRLYYRSVVVHESGNPNELLSLRAGRHTYPFRLRLPDKVAPSFTGRGVGYNRHTVIATLKGPGRKSNDTTSVIKVLGKLDLNQIPNIRRQAERVSAAENLTWMCCVKASISAGFQSNKRGYTPGEWIAVNAFLRNQSMWSVLTSVELVQSVRYQFTAREEYRTAKTLVAADGPTCASRSNVEFNDVRLKVPNSALPSGGETQTGICFLYFIKFAARFRGCYNRMEVCAPIVIGTVRLAPVLHIPPPPRHRHYRRGRHADRVRSAESSAPDYTDRTSPPPPYEASTDDALANRAVGGNLPEHPEIAPYALGQETPEIAPYALGQETPEIAPYALGQETPEIAPYALGRETPEIAPYALARETARSDFQRSVPSAVELYRFSSTTSYDLATPGKRVATTEL